MGWPIPHLSGAPDVVRPSPWFIGVAAVGIVFVCAVLVVVLWPALHGNATGTPFWLCLAGVPLLACAAFLGLVMQIYGMAVLRGRCWNVITNRMNIAWQRWSRRHVVLKAASTLTPTGELAEKIAGLAGSVPQNKTEVLLLEGFDSDFDVSRTEAVFRRLLGDLRTAINAAASNGTMRVMVWSAEDAHRESVDAMARAAWRSLDLALYATFASPSHIEWPSIGQRVLRGSTPLLILCAQLHDNGEVFKAFSESAVALLFDRPTVREHSNRPVVRLYRPMPTSVVTMRDDLRQLAEFGPFRLGQLRTAWNGGLGKAEGYTLATAVGDSGLVLQGGTAGIVSLSDHIGPVGPISPWLSLGLAAELVRYGQGAQLLAIQQGERAELAIAAADPPIPVSQGSEAIGADLRGAGLLVCISPWFPVLIGIMIGSADLFPWFVFGVVAAGVLALLFMLLQPLLVRSRAARDLLAAGGRMPTQG